MRLTFLRMFFHGFLHVGEGVSQIVSFLLRGLGLRGVLVVCPPALPIRELLSYVHEQLRLVGFLGLHPFPGCSVQVFLGEFLHYASPYLCIDLGGFLGCREP